jgi:hypothetical protein
LHIRLAGEIPDLNGFAIGATMPGRQHDHHLLPKQWQIVEAGIPLPIWPAINRSLRFRADKLLLDRLRSAVDQVQLNIRMCRAKARKQMDQQGRRDGAHDRKVQPHRRLYAIFLGSLFRGLRLFPCFLQIGAHQLAEVGQLDFRPLAPKQISAELLLQALDGARERGLCDMTLPRRLCEVQLLADCKEVSDLTNFHARQIRYFEFCVATDDHVSSVPDWMRDRQRSTISAAGPS